MPKVILTPTCEVCGATRNLTEFPSGYYCEGDKPTMPKQAQHTPTPWKYDKESNRIYAKGGADWIYTLDEGVALESDEQHEANAAFIVKACNSHGALVAALRSCRMQLRVFGKERMSEVLWNGHTASIQEADAALKLAGEEV